MNDHFIGLSAGLIGTSGLFSRVAANHKLCYTRRFARYLTSTCLSEWSFYLGFILSSSHTAPGVWLGDEHAPIRPASRCHVRPESEWSTYRWRRNGSAAARCLFTLCWALNGWEDLLNGEVHGSIIVSENVMQHQWEEAPSISIQLLGSLSCDKRRAVGSAPSDFKYKTFLVPSLFLSMTEWWTFEKLIYSMLILAY